VFKCAVAASPLEVLERVPLFAELDRAELESLGGAMREHAFSAGEEVTREGGAGDGFFVVESGRAEVTVAEQHRRTMGPGDYFGEIALLMGSERTATVTAATDLRCHVLTPSDFRILVEGSPAIAWNVLQSMVQRLG
jgi:CRP-like cAMP-binding protein